MDIRLTAFIFICIYVAVTNSATIQKLEGIEDNVKVIETDTNGNTYIVTSDVNYVTQFHALDSQNAIILKRFFPSIVSLKFNSKNELYIFTLLETNIFEHIINLWVFDPVSNEFSQPLNYSTTIDDIPAFFDDEDNLFFDSTDGISILRPNETTPVIISDLDSYNIKNGMTHAVDSEGNVFLGIRYQSPQYDAVVIIKKEEKNKPNPEPYFVNLNSKGEIHEMTTFNDAIFLAFTNYLVMLKNDHVTDILIQTDANFNHLHATSENLFLRYTNPYCYLNSVYLDYHSDNFLFFEDCLSLQETFDKEGNAFFGLSFPESEVYSVSHNESLVNTLNVLNTLYIYGLAASDKGDVWVLAQELYLIPSGSQDAVKVPGLPFVRDARPIKTKPGTDDVFIGLEDGVYIATI